MPPRVFLKSLTSAMALIMHGLGVSSDRIIKSTNAALNFRKRHVHRQLTLGTEYTIVRIRLPAPPAPPSHSYLSVQLESPYLWGLYRNNGRFGIGKTGTRPPVGPPETATKYLFVPHYADRGRAPNRTLGLVRVDVFAKISYSRILAPLQHNGDV